MTEFVTTTDDTEHASPTIGMFPMLRRLSSEVHPPLATKRAASSGKSRDARELRSPGTLQEREESHFMAGDKKAAMIRASTMKDIITKNIQDHMQAVRDIAIIILAELSSGKVFQMDVRPFLIEKSQEIAIDIKILFIDELGYDMFTDGDAIILKVPENS